MQKLTTCLWFNGNVGEALEFYTSVFTNSKVLEISHYPENTPGVPGSILTGTLQIEGQEIMLLNGGPNYTLTPAFSIIINCDSQGEVDYYWERLLEGGKPDQCGWLTDKFGVSWQIVPTLLGKLLGDSDREKADRVMQAMLKMIKLDSTELQRAYDGV